MAAWNPRANEIFLEAVEAGAGPKRTALLDSACGNDADLRRQVEALLKAHGDAGSFLEHAPVTDDTPDGEATITRAGDEGPEAHSLGFLDAPQRDGSIGRLKNYEVQSVVGSGGMGIVLKAVDESLDRVVAIKVLSPHYAANATARKRFVREAKAVAAVIHDHVVTVHAVGDESDPVPYLVMQFVQGVSLQERIDRRGPLELKEVLRIGTQIARGLAAAHAQGIMHRDIKPANILLENGVERVKITDFGLARTVDDASVTQSGVIAGTPMFMSPEQAAGESVDPRSDLFSLGSVLYMMCTGHAPFRATGTMAVMKRVIEDSPRGIREINADIPEWFEAIIAKLHAKKAADRFQSAKEVADLLEQHLAHLQQPSKVPLPARVAPPPVVKPRRRRLKWLMIGLTAALPILAGAYVQFSKPLKLYWADHGELVVYDLQPEFEEFRVERLEGQSTAQVGNVKFRNFQQWKVRRGESLVLPPGGYYVEAVGRGGEKATRWRIEGSGLLSGYGTTKDGERCEVVVGRGWRLRLSIAQWEKVPPPVAPRIGTAVQAVVPFDAARAKDFQEVWAKHLGTDVEITNSIGMKLRLIPPGEFQIGSDQAQIDAIKRLIPPVEKGQERDKNWLDAVNSEWPTTPVRLTKPYRIGVHEVTVGQFRQFVEAKRYKTIAERDGKGGKISNDATSEWEFKKDASWQKPGPWELHDDQPVVQVTWGDANEFCKWLSTREGKRYRLATEAEWEFACRAGSRTLYSSGDSELEHFHVAVYDRKSPVAVGSKKSNGFGLFDMEGNVWEWVADWAGDYSGKAQENPRGPETGDERMSRGGSFASLAWMCRPAVRDPADPFDRTGDQGFRVVLEINTP